MFTPSPTGSGSSISTATVGSTARGTSALRSVLRSVMRSNVSSSLEEASSISASASVPRVSSPEESSVNAVLRGTKDVVEREKSASDWLRGRASGVGEESRVRKRRREKGD